MEMEVSSGIVFSYLNFFEFRSSHRIRHIRLAKRIPLPLF